MIGDAGVGKTHILNRFLRKDLPQKIMPTIGVEYATKVITTNNGGKIKAQIWDTAGQEKYRAITYTHYKKAVGALLVYDITNQKSFDNIEMWLTDLKESADDDTVLMLLGNKADLVIKRPELRKVTSE